MWKFLLIGLAALPLLALSRDALHFNPAQEVGAQYRYDLVEWHAANFLSKWVHRVVRALPWNSQSEQEKQRQVQEYFRLGDELSNLSSELRRIAAASAGDSDNAVVRLEAELQRIGAERERLRNDVEETLEANISAVVSDEGIGSFGGLVFPPVDIRLTDTPKLLVTSPRDRILRTNDVLLKPNIKLDQREAMEDKLLEDSDLSALVLDVGGVATYPASLPNNRPLQPTLRISAHEWLHHYFFFRSLGQNMFNSGDMQILNETAADIAGNEIGDRAFEMLGASPESPNHAVETIREDESHGDEQTYDFNREMRATRLRVEALLSEGKIEEAESYMEERGKFFVAHGADIRKLNQAYFAFYGTYADGPASTSPIGDQLGQFRSLTSDLGAFIEAVSSVSSYPQFLDKLEELKSRTDDLPWTYGGCTRI